MAFFTNSDCICLSEFQVAQVELLLAHHIYRSRRLVFVYRDLNVIVEEHSVEVNVTCCEIALFQSVGKLFLIFRDHLVKLINEVFSLLDIHRLLALLWNQQVHLGTAHNSKSHSSFRHLCKVILAGLIVYMQSFLAHLVSKLM